MIYLDSRYADAEISYVLDPRVQATRATIFRSPRPQSDYYRIYKWKDGDRLDLLANAYYESPSEWWRIIDANPEILDPTSIKPGQTLRIP